MTIINGTRGNDALTGSTGDDTIFGGAGDDVLIGVSYDQSIISGPPNSRPVAPTPPLSDFEKGADALFGGPGRDTLYGGGGTDTLDGGPGADVLVGGPDADTLIGGPGADVFKFTWLPSTNLPRDMGFGTARDVILDFRPGVDRIDLANYQNPNAPGGEFVGQAELRPSVRLEVGYKFEGADTVVQVFTTTIAADTDLSGPRPPFYGPVGEIVLRGRVELARGDFILDAADQAAPHVVQFPDAEHAQATRLYSAVFDRAPDAGGLEFWVNHLKAGIPLQAIANGFTAASEFQANYGTPDNGEFVALLYRNVLGREGEAGGLAFWSGVLRDFGATRAEVVVGFSESAENQAKVTAADYLL